MIYAFFKKNIKDIFLYFCITAWPFLKFYASAENQKQVSLKNFLMLFAVFLFSALFLSEIARVFFRRIHERFLGVYAVFIIWFFSYADFVKYIHTKTGVMHAFPYAIIAVILLMVFFLILSKYFPFQSFVKTFIVFLFSYSIVENIYIYVNLEENKIQKEVTSSYSFKKNMNVYFLLLDAYPRTDIFKENVKYDNENFTHLLKSKGFIVAKESYSNYPSTTSSLTSIFQMSYLKQGDINSKDILSPDKITFSILRNNGYDFVILPSHHDYLGAKNSANKIISPSSNFLFSITNIQFLSTSAFRPLIKFLRPYIYFGSKEVSTLATLKTGKKFVFMHFMHFHDFAYDENCDINCKATIPESNAINAIQNIKCTNKFVEETVDSILKHDPQSIIIIQSDHGPWFWRNNSVEQLNSRDELQRWYANIAAFYIPGLDKDTQIANYLMDSPTPVNTLRGIFSYLSDKNAELLPDHILLGTKDITHLRK